MLGLSRSTYRRRAVVALLAALLLSASAAAGARAASPRGNGLIAYHVQAEFDAACGAECDVSGEWDFTVPLRGAPRGQLCSGCSAPEFSPSGRSIAYANNRNRITIASGGGFRSRRVVDKGSNPVWSPHGTRLAFEGPRGITVVSASGSGPIRALHKGANPVWSPHGTRIAFDQGGEIMTMSSRGKGVRRLRRGSVAAWSSRGEIAYYGAHGLSVMSANGEHVHLVARDGVGADWSPDGQRLAFALQSRQQIATSDAGGRHVTRLGARGDAASAPRWSPNGNLIAVAGCARAGCGVYVMHRDGSKRQLVRNTDRDCPKGSVCSARDISWQPLLPFRRGRTNGQTFFGGGEVSRHR